MKHICIALCAFFLAGTGTVLAQQRSAEDRYIADRDRAIARFTPEKVKKLGDSAVKEEESANAALEKAMRAIVGPVEIAGLGESKLNLGSLYTGDMGFGTLDGILFHSPDWKTSIVVTTRTLFLRWMRGHKNWQDTPLPQQPERAFRADTFYFQAIDSDSAILKFAEVPLGDVAAKATQDPAYAMLAGRTQDQTPYNADEVFVAAIKGGRAFVGFAPVEPAFEVPACRSAREAAEQKAKAASEAAYTSGVRDEAAEKRAAALEQKTDAEFRSCFAKRASKEAAFADVLKRAQQLYAMMPER